MQSHDGNHFLVTSATDPEDGVCDATHCSLREAIDATNTSPNIASTPDEIDFNIPGAGPHTISLGGPLPVITEALFIEGISQPGWANTPLIEIDGSAADPGSVGVDGLVFGAAADISMVRGLAVTSFSRDGIRVFSDDTLIAFSYIGVAPDGSTAKGNGKMGIQVIGADRTIIGTNSGVGGKNVISDNGQHGISVNGGTALDPVTGTKVGGNLIGTDAAGTTALGNAAYGIFLNAFAQGSLVGGTIAQERNTISANVFGIVVAAGADGNTIAGGNRIGTDVTGLVDLGNTGGGIEIVDAGGTIIGGTAAGAGNVISGNGTAIDGANGIRITGSQAFNTLIYGNLIGVGVTGLPLGNSTNGIDVEGGANESRIGSTGGNGANTIAYNGEDGVLVGNGTGSTIRPNSIHDNGGLGIDLAPNGVTPNDTLDPDTGANDRQNFPLITLAETDGTSTIVNGTINTLADAPVTISLYVSGSCDASGNGEGSTFLAEQFLMTDAFGNGLFSVSGLGGVSAGQKITATATEGVSNSTSEFSACATVTSTAASLTVNSANDADDGSCNTTHCSLREAMNAANSQAGFQAITFAIPGSGQQTINVDAPLPPITEALTIDGTSQPGYAGTPLVVVDGPSGISSGFVLDGAPVTSGATIQGLAIVGFGGWGIEVHGSDDHILDNYLGTSDGSTAAPNGNGLLIGLGAADAEVGGNLISGNTNDGIDVEGAGSDVHGNRIGVNFSTDAALPNGEAGIHVAPTASATIIGGDTDDNPGLANWIGGNIDAGIIIDGSNGNIVQGNFIGVTGELEPLGNGAAGVSIVNGGQQNQIGAEHSGTTISGPGNIIAFNGGNGVELFSGATDADFNSIHSNAIYENGRLGIDLEGDGVTANDPGDDDDGANDLTNFPDLIEAESDGEETFGIITTTTADDALIIAFQLFVNTSCDDSGNGEGERYLTTVTTTSDGTGFAEAPFSISENLEGEWLTATTSDNTGATSEFSECFQVQGPGFGDEIHLLNPTTPLGTTTFVVEGFDPAWRSGSILYATDDELHRIQPDGTGDEIITTGFADSSPSGGPGVTAFVRTQGGDDDVWLIVDGETINVTASDATPENLRLDLYYVCGGQSMPIAVALTPEVTGATTASFQTNYDPSLSCAGGTIKASLTDGFLRTTTHGPGRAGRIGSEAAGGRHLRPAARLDVSDLRRHPVPWDRRGCRRRDADRRVAALVHPPRIGAVLRHPGGDGRIGRLPGRQPGAGRLHRHPAGDRSGRPDRHRRVAHPRHPRHRPRRLQRFAGDERVLRRCGDERQHAVRRRRQRRPAERQRPRSLRRGHGLQRDRRLQPERPQPVVERQPGHDLDPDAGTRHSPDRRVVGPHRRGERRDHELSEHGLVGVGQRRNGEVRPPAIGHVPEAERRYDRARCGSSSPAARTRIRPGALRAGIPPTPNPERGEPCVSSSLRG